MTADTLPRASDSPLYMPSFRLLWAGWTLTALAIQFYAVALVWLVLRVTGSGVELGTVLVVAAVPRAAAMLVSGVLIDRLRPRRVMVSAAAISAGLVGAIAVLLALDWLSFALLLAVAALQGLMDAFFYPGAMAQLARLVAPAQLPKANALFQTSDSIANIAGPALSGFVIGAIGLAPSFALNSVLFALGGTIVWRLRERAELEAPKGELARGAAFSKALLGGFRYAWGTPAIRMSLLMVALLNFAAIGPTIVGGALLVEQRFGGDAAMFGWLLSAYGIGALFGGLGAGWLPPVRRPGLVLAGLALGTGVGLVAIGVAPAFWIAFLIQSLIGVGTGVVSVVAISWLQARTAPDMQGRMASLLIFSAVAVDPFSNALSGVLSDISLTVLFVSAGILMAAGGAIALASRAMREVE